MDKDDLVRLRRWEEAGGTWELLARSADDATLSLCTCDGGEEMDRLTSSEAPLLAYVFGRVDGSEPYDAPS